MTSLEELQEWSEYHNIPLSIEYRDGKWTIPVGSEYCYQCDTIEEAATQFIWQARRKELFGVVYDIMRDSSTKLVSAYNNHIQVATRGSNFFNLYKVTEGAAYPSFSVSESKLAEVLTKNFPVRQ